MKALYQADFAAWANESAALLRNDAELDEEQRAQIAEELEGMARSDRRELNSRTVLLMMHLLKIEYQPEKRTRSWDLTVALQRNELEDILTQSPSFRPPWEADLAKLYARAKKAARIETGLRIFPSRNPFSAKQLLKG